SLFYTSVSPRYLWSAYPALLALAGLGIRDLVSLPEPMANPAVHQCLLVVVVALLGLALWHGTREFTLVMSKAHHAALARRPPWADAVIRDVPENAVVLSDDPWSVWWYTDRSSVLAPTSHRDGLLRVLQLYRPTYFLYVDRYGGLGGRPPFRE